MNHRLSRRPGPSGVVLEAGDRVCWMGDMDGAVRAGERGARAVVAGPRR
jgi:hypothetical protein